MHINKSEAYVVPVQGKHQILFNIFLAVHLSANLVNDQLDAQFLYSIIFLLQSSTCFEQCCAHHHQEVKLY